MSIIGGVMQDRPSEFRGTSMARGRWLLVSDIDDTFLGDDAATRELIGLGRASPELVIALNSSRPLKSVSATLEQFPDGWRPIATITAMGTEMAVNGLLDESWAHRFDGWERGPIDELARRSGWDPQPDMLQTPLKASYALRADADWQAVRNAIASAGIAAKVVISGNGELDVLPPDAGKGTATLYLAQRMCVDLSRLIVTGDSANDVDMFRVAPRGIVVGNAREELRSALTSSADCFFATRRYAGGIIEGLRHFGILPPARPPVASAAAKVPGNTVSGGTRTQ